jgi:hypothetical protein
MYNAAKAIKISDIVPSLRLHPAKPAATKRLPIRLIHNRFIASPARFFDPLKPRLIFPNEPNLDRLTENAVAEKGP